MDSQVHGPHSSRPAPLYHICVFDGSLQAFYKIVPFCTFHSATGGGDEIESLLPLISDTELRI